LELFEADLLQEGSFKAAMATCSAVFHSASPFFNTNVTDPEKQLLQPAVFGTENVLKTARETESVKRVVLTSSTASVGYNGGKLDSSHVYTENDWSDEEVLRKGSIWYPLSKTLAERAAWDFVEKHKPHFSLVVINPTLIIGPPLQTSVNTSSDFLLAYLNGSKTEITNSEMSWVDVRDVAKAHLMALEKPEANGRYLCVGGRDHYKNWVSALSTALPPNSPSRAKLPTQLSSDELKPGMKVDTSKLQALGWSSMSFQESVNDSVAAYLSLGFIPSI